ncbi:MAG: GNAT family N-acetyltransferase [Chloroflexi bacterium]|nr:GNAT family N-acetyltransferase [Chloroflexota bacterium]
MAALDSPNEISTQALPATVRSARDDDVHQLANLMHFEIHAHRHLDWRPPLEWIGSPPYLVREALGRIHAALACPPDPPRVAWIRLFAVAGNAPVEPAWDDLWSEAWARLTSGEQPVVCAAAIPLHGWFQRLLEKSGFARLHKVVVLSWNGGRLAAPAAMDGRWSLRAMTPQDLPGVEQVDTAAFGELWRNSPPSLEVAYRSSAVATVAESGGRLVGYQISTPTPAGGHLARLAVIPDAQGNGLGYWLLYDLLKAFERRGVRNVTVNTQNDNLTSLALYQKAGFKRTGEDYPVYWKPVE